MTLEFKIECLSPFFIDGKERLPPGSKIHFSVETDGRLKQEVKDLVVDLLIRHGAITYEIKNWDSLPEV